MTTQFWMVFGINQGCPTHTHDSLESARAEAKRLARLHPEIEFVVLEAVEGFVKRDLATFNYRRATDDCDEIPF